MKAMVLRALAPLAVQPAPLSMVELPIPAPAPGEILVQVAACGVCHTELDEIEGRLPPPHLPIVLGHQVVGRVCGLGVGVTRHRLGDRVGIGWIHSSTGDADENLSSAFRAMGMHANGGYAEFTTVPEAYAYAIPQVFEDFEAAPLLCAGAIGYRSLKLAGLQSDPLGLMGFGGSAHIVLQLARHIRPGRKVAVFARDAEVRDFALSLGADWVGATRDRAPYALRAIIDTTPAWEPVVASLDNLGPGGRLVINAIRKEEADKDALQRLSYHDHLWLEREIKSVANITGADIAEFLAIAGEVPIRPEVTTYRLEDANRALVELRSGRVRGAKVLVV